MKKILSILLATIVVITSGIIPSVPVLAEVEAQGTGDFTTAGAPVVTVTFNDTGYAMTPQTEQTVTVNVAVGTGRTLEEITGLTFKTWYDSDGGAPTAEEYTAAVADTQACAVVSWSGAEFTLASGDNSTWSLVSGTAPTLTESSGDFVLIFKPGKVAFETSGQARWQMAAQVSSSLTSAGFGSHSYELEAVTYYGVSMNWYGELVITGNVNIDWGAVPAGMDYTNAKAKQALGTDITYISNGYYAEEAKSSSTWEGVSTSATLNTTGTPTNNEFCLKAANDDSVPADGNELDTVGKVLNTSDGSTTESGDTASNNNLWLKLGSTFSQDTYSGTITYMVGTSE